ncbi:NADP-dependent oxidoreductase [Actinocatenispora rupis]|uniref:Oxidoreductase n=1 Tax=Actinocatenispora rupis TaxID=519421 RepID=A0A8J3NAQ6_9ACTN|nr:NADP-dependent oxidoreductase [Actinocatenispora rupis]GID12351.1 oxidoreductase [Actinocatenispora rupis]
MPDEYQVMAFARYGGPDVLRVATRTANAPGPGQVRLRVRAAGVNPLDRKLRAGALAEWLPVELPYVPGTDVAGVVDALGAGVDGIRVGDEVFGKAQSGSYAQQAIARAERIAAKPADLSWEVAAALPVAATTARHALAAVAVTAGETLVIDGAAGGVGTLAVQLARRAGVRVIGTASEPNHAHLRSLGAQPIRYGHGLARRVAALAPQGVDAALDAAGHGSLPDLIGLVGRADRVVSLADTTAQQLGARFLSDEPDDLPAVLADVAALAAAGEVRLPVTTYRLVDAAVAHADGETGHARGKLVLLAD